ncbi:prepilin peptidase [Candidatus Saganbacteria bacterium]|nr:prepilin peptidase [Candidatus Saganbacteria bacterium]
MILIFSFVFGLVVGSFLNVCIYRLPRGESIVFPASHCPECGQTLRPLDLIPVLSFLFLRGRCRYCRTKITWRYPLVELITGVLFVLTAAKFYAQPLDWFFGWLFLPLLAAIFFIDLEKMVVPDALSYGGIFLGLIYNLIKTIHNAPGDNFLFSSLLGLLLGFSILFSVGWLGKRIFKKEAVGEGDWYIAGSLGAGLGWQLGLLALFLAYLFSAVVILGFLAVRRLKLGDYVPFGPALAAGGVVAFFWGQTLLSWYLGQ